jgi:hypothetical protein
VERQSENVKDLEEKNNKLNELFNQTVYERAEDYKTKILHALTKPKPSSSLSGSIRSNQKFEPINSRAVIDEEEEHEGEIQILDQKGKEIGGEEDDAVSNKSRET